MKEIRFYSNSIGTNNERTIEGKAICFNSTSNEIHGFYESIERNAITDETILKSDIVLLLEHNQDRGILGRCNNGKGSLEISIKDDGVYFRCEMPKTSLGDEALEGIRRGDYNQCSFAFSLPQSNGDKWEKKDGKYYRTITQINKLYDFSLVCHPAYNDTFVDCRGMEKLKEDEKELKEYYTDIRENFKVK